MKKIKEILLVVMMLSIVSISSAATLKGKVVDSVTKEPLIGAAVYVPATAQGVTTDIDGAFELRVNNGLVSVEFSYISYLTKIIEIDVNRKTPELLIELSTDTQSISEVVVSTRKNLENEATLQNERIASNVAIENMGAKEMSIKGISNVQEGVKKLTGISVASAGQLIVRGLGDRYSTTTLNGQPIASPNPDNKLIPLDIFPSSTVKNITVSKVYNADEYADYSGAHVDIATKDLTSDDFFSVGFNVGGNSNTTFQEFYSMDNLSLLTQSVEDQAMVDHVMDKGELNNYVLENGNPFDTGFNVTKSKALPVFGGNVAWGQGYDVGNQKLSILAAAGINNDNQTDLDALSRIYEASNSKTATDEYYTDNYESELKIATLANVGMTMRENDRISYTLFYARNASEEYSLSQGYDYEDNNLTGSNSVTHIYKLLTHQINSIHELGDSWGLNITGAYTTTSSEEPDRRQVMYKTLDNGKVIFFDNKQQETMRYFGNLSESELNGEVSLDYKFGEDDAHKLVFGAAYKNKNRDYAGRRYYYNITKYNQVVGMPNFSMDDIYNADNFLSWENLQNGAFNYVPSYQSIDNYDAESSVASGYVAADLSYSKWLINAGLRYEQSSQSVNYATGSDPDANRTYSTYEFFPALNVKYSMGEKSQMRFAASRTVTRPSFIEMAPFLYQESYSSIQIKGNADLVNGYNYNVDLRYETFFDKGDMFSVTGYYKFLESPIERTQQVSGGGEVHTFNNAESGVAAGVELEARKTIIDGLRLGVNGSYMYTNVSLSNEQFTNNNRALQGASPYLLNADLTYSKYLDDDGRAMNFALLYNLQGPRIHTVGTATRGDIYQLALHTLNFNFSYSLTKRVQLSVQATNLLNRDEVYEQKISGVDVVTERHNYGIGGKVGISMKF